VCVKQIHTRQDEHEHIVIVCECDCV